MRKGFTIIETLVAISILMIAIAGPLTIANQAITSAITAKNQMIASNLAQETIEYINNIKDNNIVGNNDWLHGVDDLSTAYDGNAGTVSCTGSGDTCGASPIEGSDLGTSFSPHAPIDIGGCSTSAFTSGNCLLTVQASGNGGYDYESSGGIISQTTPSPTIFTRYFYFTPVMVGTSPSVNDIANEILLDTVVTWNTGAVSDQIHLQALLTSTQR